jgi:dipeptidyl aminopeptidase/acylaminoacyl peptidase
VLTLTLTFVAAAAAIGPIVTAQRPIVRPKPPGADEMSRLTIDKLMDIKHPSAPIWSRDSKRVAFMWDRAGVSNLYVASADGSTSPVAVTSDGAAVGGMFWSVDSTSIFFTREGRLMQVGLDGSSPPKTLWAAGFGAVPSPDGTRVAYAVGGDRGGGAPTLHVRGLPDGADASIGSFAGANGLFWRDANTLTVVIGGVGETINHDEAPSYSGAKLIFRTVENVPAAAPPQFALVPASGGEATRFSIAPVPGMTFGGRGGFRWIDDSHVLFDRTVNFKKRSIYVAEVHTGQSTAVHEDDKSKTFWSVPPDAQAGSQASPDGQWISFLSDRDGWDHLYVMPATGGDAVQITKGSFEAWRPAWSPDATRIAFDSNEGPNPGARHIGIANINGDPSKAWVRMVTSGRGADVQPAWSPDGRRVLYQHSDPQNSADLYVVDVTTGGSPPVRLTDSMPKGLDKTKLVEPELIHYPGPDGQMVPAWLFVPKTLDRATKHPAIVWVHGDGYNEGYDGWHVQRNYAVYYSFHQYLLQQGYVVITPDYRGSIGYGSAWRDGQYMDIGGKDFHDAAASATYLKSLAYVDPNRIGIWGLSYGGFVTLLSVTSLPTTFACGVDVAGPGDWAMYYGDPYHGAWTESRIGTPDEHPQVYAQASPISHVDALVRPLLILHGTADVNVPFLQSVRLIDELLKQGKGGLVSFMMYPGEFHYFTREHVLKDAWTRVAAFYKEHLKP